MKDTKKYQFEADVAKVLQLMAHSLYTNKDVAIREMVSNASDACDKLRYLGISNPGLVEIEPKIVVTIDKNAKTITFLDTGIGMSAAELVDNLGTIAKSGTQRFSEALEQSKNLQLIGQFGVGFYSAFMIADKITVISTKAGEGETNVWESYGGNEFLIYKHEVVLPHGTSVILHIKDVEESYLDKYKLQHIISTYSAHISFSVELNADGATETVTQGGALWLKSKSEISDEEYQQFYKGVSFHSRDFWHVIHNKMEGKVECTSLLFIPKDKPYNLYHPDRKTNIKLYIKRVFITEDNIGLLPSFLRFIYGVIDSSDLPLNISRETLQYNTTIEIISKSIVKKILSELEKESTENPERYLEFWKNFGEVVKEGLCEMNFAEKESIMKVCRFYSTKSGDIPISLDEYLERMKDGQEAIYFLVGDDLDSLRKKPQLEVFRKKDIEVLLFKDNVDDFWVNVVHKYKDKKIQSIASGSVNMGEDSGNSASDTVDVGYDTDAIDALVTYMKSFLKEKVKDVIVSTKLVDSPVCLSLSDGAMSARMEKILMDQKQINRRSAKILEINPRHKIIKHISDFIKNGTPGSSDYSKADDLIEVMFGQASLLAADHIENPSNFVEKINIILTSFIESA